MDILNHIKDYLEKRRGTWPQIAADAGVTYTWLTKIVQGKIANPGIKDLQKVLNYIKKNP